MAILNQNSTSQSFFMGWYGTCDAECQNINISTSSFRDKIYKIFQIQSDNLTYVGFDGTIPQNLDSTLQPFLEFECGKFYIIILNSGTGSVDLTHFKEVNSGSTDSGRVTQICGSVQPQYSLSSNLDSANEGESVTITLSTQGVSEGTLIPYTISGSNITPEDFTKNTFAIPNGYFDDETNGWNALYTESGYGPVDIDTSIENGKRLKMDIGGWTEDLNTQYGKNFAVNANSYLYYTIRNVFKYKFKQGETYRMSFSWEGTNYPFFSSNNSSDQADYSGWGVHKYLLLRPTQDEQAYYTAGGRTLAYTTQGYGEDDPLGPFPNLGGENTKTTYWHEFTIPNEFIDNTEWYVDLVGKSLVGTSSINIAWSEANNHPEDIIYIDDVKIERVSNDSVLTGHFVVGSDGTSSLTLELNSDTAFEDLETFTVTLDDHSEIFVNVDINSQ